MWAMAHEAGEQLTERTRWVWAKSRRDERSRLVGWLPLYAHLWDTAQVAGLLWDEWLGGQRRALLTGFVGGDEGAARAVAVFLAGVHDLGKATLPFALKVPQLAERMRESGLPFTIVPSDDEARGFPHALAGQVALERLLEANAVPRPIARQLGSVVGSHHGIPPALQEVQRARLREDLLGGEPWEEVRAELVAQALATSELELDWLASVRLSTPALAVLTGLVVMADWVASNHHYFPDSAPGRLPVLERTRVELGWKRLGLPRAWRVVDTGGSASDLLRERFGIDAGARAVQEAAVEVARTCDLPGVVVIEAPMGEGKTEAALLAAEILASRTGAVGLANALPTQATTNAMFERIARWLPRVPDADDAEARRSLVLAHGKAQRVRAFLDLARRDRGGEIGIDEPGVGRGSEVIVHEWMSSRKKSPLADVLVATVDQVLFAALQARYLMLRHLGLAGKVVVIDEVHAYDAYMNVYLRRALEWLGAFGCPVVLLSATLTEATRRSLVEAYLEGRRSVTGGQRRNAFAAWGVPQEAEPAPKAETVYPAIWCVRDEELVCKPVSSTAREQRVALELLDDDPEDLEDRLETLLRGGGCALVVRNTVSRAQETFDRFTARWGEDRVTLAHSRFTDHDRALLDEGLVARFGPGADNRPEWHVVVATQVAEQSLDVDFDLLVTDLAPIDLVLQRVGRLHRHDRARPAELSTPRCIVTGVRDWDASPLHLDQGGQAVYGRFPLLQAAALMSDRSRSSAELELPSDIAPWVAAAYGDEDLGPQEWAQDVASARREHEAARIKKETAAKAFRLTAPQPSPKPLSGWFSATVGEADESDAGRAQVRDGSDSLEVALLARTPDGAVAFPTWMESDEAARIVPTEFAPDEETALRVTECLVRIPERWARGERGDKLIEELESRWYFPAWQRVPHLRGLLVLVLDEPREGLLTGDVAGLRFTYERQLGLKVEREADERVV